MAELRKQMVAAVAALLKAGSRSNEAVATAMSGVVVDQIKTLQEAHKVASARTSDSPRRLRVPAPARLHGTAPPRSRCPRFATSRQMR